MSIQLGVDTAGDEGDLELSPVQKFFDGGSVLVTGGTGFMGKVLIEKLLWSCPGVSAIYVLVRNKKGKTVQERIDDLVNSPCFGRLRRERGPGFKSRVIGIQGDVCDLGLGLSEDDRQLLATRVTVVFHVAATVRFDEHLNHAVKLNVRGTREVLALCRTCVQLKAIVHMSTAYANCPFPTIEERFHETPLDCDQVIKMAECVSADIMTSMTKKILGAWPNSYVFTKALAEQVIRKHGQGLPVAISRPGIVVCTSEEPMSGWIDNFSGPTGLTMGSAAGFTRTTHTNTSAVANIVPCDLAINSVIVAAWDVAEKRSILLDLPIYNFVLPRANAIKWGYYRTAFKKMMMEYPLVNGSWYPIMIMVASRPMALTLRFLLHMLPGFLIDFGLRVQGKPPKMCKIYERVHKFIDQTRAFGSGHWNFEEKNVYALWALTSKRDKELFPFDLRQLDWEEFFSRSYLGMRKLLMNEDNDTIPLARAKLQRLVWIHRLTVTVAVVLFFWVAKSFFSGLHELIHISFPWHTSSETGNITCQ